MNIDPKGAQATWLARKRTSLKSKCIVPQGCGREVAVCIRLSRGGPMETLRDLALSARSLRKTPAFTITSIITIALGIGASTAIFSVVNAVLLRPLPYANRDKLVIITNDLTRRNVKDFPLA